MVDLTDSSVQFRRILVRSHKQHTLLGHFGKSARLSRSFTELAKEAAHVAAEGTGAPLAMILSHVAESRTLRLEAAVGWPHELVDGLSLPIDENSTPAKGLANGGPLALPDIEGAPDVAVAPHQRANGVRRALTAPVHAAHGPIGVIEVSDISTGPFENSDLAFLEGLAILLGLAHDREAERVGRNHLATLQRNLLRERVGQIASLHREVKNSLQVIHALLVLQASEITDPAARAILEDSAQRVITIGAVHEQLAHHPDVTLVDMRSYVTSLVNKMAETLRDRFPVADNLQLELDEAVWTPARAHLLGMVLTELMLHIGALDPTMLRVIFREAGEKGSARLILERDGEGELDLPQAGSLSLRLVRELLRDSDGQVIEETGSRSRLTVFFPAPPETETAAAGG